MTNIFLKIKNKKDAEKIYKAKIVVYDKHTKENQIDKSSFVCFSTKIT